jgi:uncharacterized membrane protein
LLVDIDELTGTDSAAVDFNLPSSTRHSLSALLVVHPIAALFNLICLGLAGAAHFHSPSHSARYLLALLILLLPTLLVTLLAFLVDILLFVPHLQWGGWIVLASTILITASGVVTCAMRRTLVSRKARKKRIAENAEMSGESFYNRQNALPKVDPISLRSGDEPKAPMVNGAPGSNTLPAFATFSKEQDVSVDKSDLSQTTSTTRVNGGSLGFRGANGEGLAPTRSRSQDQLRGPRDEYGAPLAPYQVSGPNTVSLRSGPSDPSLRQRFSQERMNGPPTGPRGGYGYAGPGGRGYPPRGGYGPPRGVVQGPRGGSNHGPGRGAYNDGRGNYHYGRGRGAAYDGGRGNYPNGRGRGAYDDGRGNYHNGPGRGGVMAAEVGAGMAAGAMMGRPQPGPPPGYPPYGQRIPPGQYGSQDDLRRAPSQEYRGAPGGPLQQFPRRTPPLAEDVPSVGQAVEMDVATGRISQATGRPGEGEIAHNMVTMRTGQVSPSSQYSPADMPGPPDMRQPADLAKPNSMYSHGQE